MAIGLMSLAGLAMTGCSGSLGGYCFDAAECEGGNERDEEACNLAFEETQDLAEVQNCTSEFDSWFECIEESSRCNDDRYQADEGTCGNEWEQLDRCADLGGQF